jgi:hypothetical protein
MHFEIDAPSNDVITMNLTIAALDRWLANGGSAQSGEEIGREIGAMYREIHAVVDEISPDEVDDEDDEEEEEEVLVARG